MYDLICDMSLQLKFTASQRPAATRSVATSSRKWCWRTAWRSRSRRQTTPTHEGSACFYYVGSTPRNGRRPVQTRRVTSLTTSSSGQAEGRGHREHLLAVSITSLDSPLSLDNCRLHSIICRPVRDQDGPLRWKDRVLFSTTTDSFFQDQDLSNKAF